MKYRSDAKTFYHIKYKNKLKLKFKSSLFFYKLKFKSSLIFYVKCWTVCASVCRDYTKLLWCEGHTTPWKYRQNVDISSGGRFVGNYPKKGLEISKFFSLFSDSSSPSRSHLFIRVDLFIQKFIQKVIKWEF